MNNALQNALTHLLHQISSAGHVVANQLPDVLRQLIAYNIVREWFLVVFFTFLFGAWCGLWVWTWRDAIRLVKEGKWDEDQMVPFLKFAGPISIGGATGFGYALVFNILTLIQLEFMPKAWLLGYIRSAIGH